MKEGRAGCEPSAAAFKVGTCSDGKQLEKVLTTSIRCKWMDGTCKHEQPVESTEEEGGRLAIDSGLGLAAVMGASAGCQRRACIQPR